MELNREVQNSPQKQTAMDVQKWLILEQGGPRHQLYVMFNL